MASGGVVTSTLTPSSLLTGTFSTPGRQLIGVRVVDASIAGGVAQQATITVDVYAPGDPGSETGSAGAAVTYGVGTKVDIISGAVAFEGNLKELWVKEGCDFGLVVQFTRNGTPVDLQVPNLEFALKKAEPDNRTIRRERGHSWGVASAVWIAPAQIEKSPAQAALVAKRHRWG